MTARRGRRPADLRRSWLFLPGAEREILLNAVSSAADVLIQELEDFVPAGPSRKPAPRDVEREPTGSAMS